MKDIIKDLENKKMVHNYINMFIEPDPNLMNEDKIKINEEKDYIIGSYSNKDNNPFNENINAVIVISNTRVLIDYKKSIIIKNDEDNKIMEKSESHIGGFELKDNKVDMTKVITNRTRTNISDKEEETIVKRGFKYFRGENDLLNNPYGFDEISLKIKKIGGK